MSVLIFFPFFASFISHTNNHLFSGEYCSFIKQVNNISRLGCSGFSNFSNIFENSNFEYNLTSGDVLLLEPHYSIIFGLNELLVVIRFSNIDITFFNLKGFYLTIENPALAYFETVSFFQSNFDFYLNNKIVKSCDDLYNYTAYIQSIFNSFFSMYSNQLLFGSVVNFNSRICPLLFIFYDVNLISFELLIDSFIKKMFSDLIAHIIEQHIMDFKCPFVSLK